MRTLSSVFACLLVLGVFSVGYAQDQDSIRAAEEALLLAPPPNLAPVEETVEADTTPPPFFSDIHIWGDIAKPLTRFITDHEQFEVGAGIVLFDHVQLAGSYGESDRIFEAPAAYTNGRARSTGTYWRAGIDYIAGQSAKTFVGLRYAQGTFRDSLQLSFSDEVFGDFTVDYSDAFTVTWWEFVVGTEAAPFKQARWLENLKLGWMLRMRTINSFQQPLDRQPVYYIPGYGRTANPVTFNLNVTLRYRLGR